MNTTNRAKLVRGTLALAALIGAALLPADATAAMQGSGGSAQFDAVGPAGFKLQGKTSDVSVSESGGSIKVTVALSNLDTGIELRNKHMREKYLEVPKYPNAVLTVDRASLKLPDDGQSNSASAPGTMSIHGQSHPVTVNYKVRRNHDAYDVSGTVHVNMNDYGIQVPSYLGITVKPDVDVTASFVAHDG